TERGRVDAVARPLQLDPPEAARFLVHLKEDDDGDAAYGFPTQDDIDIAVAEIKTSRELRCGAVELLQQVLRSLPPMNLTQQLWDRIRSRPSSGEHEHQQQQDRVETHCSRFPPLARAAQDALSSIFLAFA